MQHLRKTASARFMEPSTPSWRGPTLSGAAQAVTGDTGDRHPPPSCRALTGAPTPRIRIMVINGPCESRAGDMAEGNIAGNKAC